MRRRALLSSLAGAMLLWPGAAYAHLMTTGLGPIYDGISHLFLTFDDLLPVIAMALLAGLSGPATGRRVLFILPAAWLAGGVAGYLTGVAPLPAGVTSLSLVALGVLTAADRKLSALFVTALAVTLGTVHGWLNGAATAAAGREATGLVGIAGAIFLMVALAS
ncbi:MAG: HupE/UreJ family protein, partial [Acidithiobacillales bacterium]